MPQQLPGVTHMQEDFDVIDVIDELRGTNLDKRALRIPKPSAFGSPKVCLGRAPARASLWSEIERLAVEMAAREPFLRHMLDETVLSQETPARIVPPAPGDRPG